MDGRTSKRAYFCPLGCWLQPRNGERVCSGICIMREAAHRKPSSISLRDSNCPSWAYSIMTRCWYASRRFVYLFAFILSAKVLILCLSSNFIISPNTGSPEFVVPLSMGLQFVVWSHKVTNLFGKGQMFFPFFSYVYTRGVKFYRTAIIKYRRQKINHQVSCREGT